MVERIFGKTADLLKLDTRLSDLSCEFAEKFRMANFKATYSAMFWDINHLRNNACNF